MSPVETITHILGPNILATSNTKICQGLIPYVTGWKKL